MLSGCQDISKQFEVYENLRTTHVSLKLNKKTLDN